MSVTLIEPALERLLDSQEGPVGEFVELQAQHVVLQAGAEIIDYFRSAPGLVVELDVDYEMQGSSAIIGIKDAGSKSRRLAASQADGRVNWLQRALRVVGF